MVRQVFAVGIAALLLVPATKVSTQAGKTAAPAGPTVVFEVANKGTIEMVTYPDEAPKSVERFLELAKKGFYRGQRFHWVQTGSIVQAGDPLTRDLTKRREWGTGGSGPRMAPRPIGVSEPSKRKWERGSVGYAFRPDRKSDSADSQFFILLTPNPALNGKYTMLGKVVKGIEVADKVQPDDVIKNVTVK